MPHTDPICPLCSPLCTRHEYRKIKRPFPPTARANSVDHPVLPGTTPRRASASSSAVMPAARRAADGGGVALPLRASA
jgi:hypothetical protein